MRSYPDPKDEWELKDLQNLKAPEWMVELLKLNPSYTSWGPGEDDMGSDAERYGCKSWEEMTVPLDDFNEVVDFYFEVYRPEEVCSTCDGSGLNEQTRQIEKGFSRHGGWGENLTQEDVRVLAKSGHLHVFRRGERKGKFPTVDEVNKAQRMPSFDPSLFIDAIGRSVLVEARAKREGVYGECKECKGRGSFHTGDARLRLVLWVLHPRHSQSLGVAIESVEEKDLPEVFQYLHQADMRNAERFSRVTEQWRIQKGRRNNGLER